MKSIDIDLDVYKAIVANQHDFDETPNAVLRRLLGVEPDDAAGATTEPAERPVAPHPPEHRAPAAEVRSDDRPTGDLVDKSRGLMVGVAVGNLLGIPYEGGRWNRARIVAEFPDGIREIAAKPGWPDDDDLAQSILLAEASIATDAYDINDLARRFWKWGELNARGWVDRPDTRCGCLAAPNHAVNCASMPASELRPAFRPARQAAARRSMHLAWHGKRAVRPRRETVPQCGAHRSHCAGWTMRKRWCATALSALP